MLPFPEPQAWVGEPERTHAPFSRHPPHSSRAREAPSRYRKPRKIPKRDPAPRPDSEVTAADLDEASASTQHAKSPIGTPVEFVVDKVSCAERVADFEAFPEFGGQIPMQVDFGDVDVPRGGFQLHRGTSKGRGLPSEARTQLWPPETPVAARAAPRCDNPRHALGEPANGQPTLRSWRPRLICRISYLCP